MRTDGRLPVGPTTMIRFIFSHNHLTCSVKTDPRSTLATRKGREYAFKIETGLRSVADEVNDGSMRHRLGIQFAKVLVRHLALG